MVCLLGRMWYFSGLCCVMNTMVVLHIQVDNSDKPVQPFMFTRVPCTCIEDIDIQKPNHKTNYNKKPFKMSTIHPGSKCTQFL